MGGSSLILAIEKINLPVNLYPIDHFHLSKINRPLIAWTSLENRF